MRKKKTFEYTSYFAAEFNGFLQYRISGGSNGLEERRVLKSLDDYLIQSGMVKKKLDGIIVDAWINSLNVGGNTKAHYVSVYRQFAHYLTGLGYKAYIPPPLQIKRNYTPYVFTSEEMKRLFEACDNIPARRSLTKAEVWLPVMVRMLYGCGLRVGEAVSLQNKDIDWTEGTLLIRAAKGNKDRLVPMSNSLIDVCRTYTDVERGERGSTEEHLTVTQFKLQAEQHRLETVTGQVEQAEQSLADAKAATEKQKKKLEALQKETKAAKTIALTVQDIEEMGKKNALTGNVSLTPDQCDTLKRYAVNGIIANADNKRLKEKLASAEKTISIWKQRYEAVNEKYMELKQKAQPFLDAIEIASERVWAFVHAILARGKETQEHKHPARKRRQDMEI